MMKIAIKLMKRYSFFLITVAALLLLLLINRELGKSAVEIAGVSLKGMATIIFPIFILLGLLDVWVSRETMMKYMGDGSGIKGVLLAVFLGSAAAGPLYGAFPVAAVLMKKGVKFSNILIFINLILIAIDLFRISFKNAETETVGHTISKYLPVYLIWILIVVFLFPVIFGMK